MKEADFEDLSEAIAELRVPHEPIPLTEDAIDPDPIVQFGRWMSDALGAGVLLPNAMSLATATTDGRPSARMVLLKAFDEHGFVFYTNLASRKARELEVNPQAALVFYWHRLERQVRISGRVERVSEDEARAYFEGRPLGSKLSAWASRQSEVIAGRSELEGRFDEMRSRYRDDVPLPPFWGGYRLRAAEIEFWQGMPDRLHDRLLFVRDDQGWTLRRLAP